MSDAISISFCINDSYAQHLAVVITSILVNNPDDDFVFHVLHSDVTDASIAKVRELEQIYPRHRIEFHHIDASIFAGLPVPAALEHVTIEMYYRFLLPQILADEKRTIYSDVDVLCVGRIKPLWKTSLNGNILAAVSEGQAGEFKKQLIGLKGDSPYFNSGLLLMNLESMRRDGSVKTLFDTAHSMANRLAWPDQDVINTVFRGRILQLGSEWGGIDVRYSPFRNDIVVWHFLGWTQKPWCNIRKNRAWPLYLRYLRKSPYRDQAWPFIRCHLKGFFYFKYTKKGVARHLLFGLLVWKHKANNNSYV